MNLLFIIKNTYRVYRMCSHQLSLFDNEIEN